MEREGVCLLHGANQIYYLDAIQLSDLMGLMRTNFQKGALKV
jgi:hypothetical protein